MEGGRERDRWKKKRRKVEGRRKECKEKGRKGDGQLLILVVHEEVRRVL